MPSGVRFTICATVGALSVDDISVFTLARAAAPARR